MCIIIKLIIYLYLPLHDVKTKLFYVKSQNQNKNEKGKRP